MCVCVCGNVERICFPVVLLFMLLYLCRFSRDLLVHIMLQVARGKQFVVASEYYAAVATVG